MLGKKLRAQSLLKRDVGEERVVFALQNDPICVFDNTHSVCKTDSWRFFSSGYP